MKILYSKVGNLGFEGKGFIRFWSDDVAVMVENLFDLVTRTWNQIRVKLKIPQRDCEAF